MTVELERRRNQRQLKKACPLSLPKVRYRTVQKYYEFYIVALLIVILYPTELRPLSGHRV